MAAPRKIQAILNLEIPAGKANPSPPLGPMLGANGVAIGSFTQDFNAQTQPHMQQFAGADVCIKCKLTVFADRTYDLKLLGPKTGDLIKWKLGLKSGSGEPNKKKVGKITRTQLEELAEIQKDAMNTTDLEAIIKIIAGTAKNMGLEIEAGAVTYNMA
jgi:large subunit ribosomal protein L11